MEVFNIRCEGDIEECIRRTQKGDLLQPRIFSPAMAEVYQAAVRQELENEAKEQINESNFLTEFLDNYKKNNIKKDDDEPGEIPED